jgi:hypothetical protein
MVTSDVTTVPYRPADPARTGRTTRRSWPRRLIPARLTRIAAVSLLMAMSVPVATYLALTRDSLAPVIIVLVPVAVVAAVARPAVLVLAALPMFVFAIGIDNTVISNPAAVLLYIATLVLAMALQPAGPGVRAAHGWVALFGGAVLASAAWPTMHLAARSQVGNLGSLLLGLTLLSAAIAIPLRPRTIAALTAGSGALSAAYCLIAGAQEASRLTGLRLDPNTLSALLAPPLVAAVGLALHTRQARWLLLGAPIAAAFVATGSRGGLVAVLAGLALLVFDAFRRWRRPLIVLGAAAVVVSLLDGFAWLSGLVHLIQPNRSADQLQQNTDARVGLASAALHAAIHHPLRGLGYGMFPPYAAQDPDLMVFLNTHNDFLRLAAEAGVPTLVLFCLLLWLGLGTRHPGDLGVLRAVATTAAVNLCFHNTLANVRISTALWLSLGCLIAHRGPLMLRARRPAMRARP